MSISRIQKIKEGVGEVSYKLGIFRNKLHPHVEGFSGVKIPKGYEFPRQHEEIEKAVKEIYKKINEAKSNFRYPIV